jgi:hypothetical protein
MVQPGIRPRALPVLLAGGIALGALVAPVAGTSNAYADHLPPSQHKSTDFSVTLRLSGKDTPIEYGSHQYFTADLSSRLVFDAVMSNAGYAPQSVDDGVDRTRLRVTLPPALTNVVVPPSSTDVCSVTTISEPGKIPGTIIECEASYFALNGVNAELLYPNRPRSVRFEATAPHEEGEHTISATVQPVKYWDSAPGNNTVTGHLKLVPMMVSPQHRPKEGLVTALYTCVQGYVWREAFSGDYVCVTPGIREQTWADNAQAQSRIDPVNKAWGPNTCKQGYVWREASSSDLVCVTPETREQARADNAQAQSRIQR